MRTAKAEHLAKTIMDDLEALLATSTSYEEPSASIAKALKENERAFHTAVARAMAWYFTMPDIRPQLTSLKAMSVRRPFKSGWAGPTRHSFSTTRTLVRDPGNKPVSHWKDWPGERLRE